jgi:acyl dehydratase
MPPLERSLSGVTVAPGALADYARVCGFTLRDTLPATYLHIKAFPLHMQLMTDGKFPFPAVGLVHVSNRIVVHRPAHVADVFDLVVRTTPIEPHPKGRTFALVSTATVDGELVWEDVSTMLRRGRGGTADERESAPVQQERVNAHLVSGVEWKLPGDLGRRYGGVSGDRNPIHLHALTARAFGFPQAIAHGMWTKARCLAALEPLPAAYTVDVSFKKPILLPGRVTFAAGPDGFVVRSAKRSEVIHLEGTVTP